METDANALAEEIRRLLSEKARDQYGDYKTVARMMGRPHKTVYRYLTENGHDKQMPPLPFVIELVDLLRRDAGGKDFDGFVSEAMEHLGGNLDD